MPVGCDFCLNCFISMLKHGWRKISAMHVILKVGINTSSRCLVTNQQKLLAYYRIFVFMHTKEIW